MKKFAWLVVSCLMVWALIAPAMALEPTYGGTLRFSGRYQEMTGWDFTSKWTGGNEAILTLTYDSLLNGDWERGPSGTKEFNFYHSYTIPEESAIGYIAESWTLNSPTKITFKIRKGIKWHNKHPTFGRELTAKDVLFAYEWVKKARWPRQKFIKAMSAPDDYTFVIEFTRPMPFWRYEVGYTPYFLIFPKETADAGIEDWRNHAGTGPFMVTDYKAGSSITFTRNPDYWKTWKYKGKEYKLPFVDKIVRLLILDTSTRLAAIQTAKIDMGLNIPAKFMGRVKKAAPDLNLNSSWDGSSAIIHYRFDRSDLPTIDIRVRQALNMALDRKAISDAVYGGESEIEARPFGDQSFLPALKDAPPAFQMLYDYNPEKAKKYLADAGYPKGFKIGFMYGSASETNRAMAEMIMYYWKQIGVKAVPEPLETAIGFGKFSKRDFDISLWGHDGCLTVPWSMKEGDEDVWMNASEFNDPEFHEGWEKAKQEMDPAVRVPIQKRIVMRYFTEVAVTCLPQSNWVQYWWPWVNNYNGEYNIGYLDIGYLSYVYLDRALRTKKIGYKD